MESNYIEKIKKKRGRPSKKDKDVENYMGDPQGYATRVVMPAFRERGSIFTQCIYCGSERTRLSQRPNLFRCVECDRKFFKV